VRVVEAAEVILTRNPLLIERVVLWLALAICRSQLRWMVAAMPAEITAEILAASEKTTGPVRGFTQN